MRVMRESKLAFARLFIESGVQYWGLPDFPSVEPANDDILHEVGYGDRLDLLSQRYYGRPDLMWIIALNNGIAVYPNEVNPGTDLRIPSRNRVENVILPSAQKGREGRL